MSVLSLLFVHDKLPLYYATLCLKILFQPMLGLPQEWLPAETFRGLSPTVLSCFFFPKLSVTRQVTVEATENPARAPRRRFHALSTRCAPSCPSRRGCSLPFCLLLLLSWDQSNAVPVGTDQALKSHETACLGKTPMTEKEATEHQGY